MLQRLLARPAALGGVLVAAVMAAALLPAVPASAAEAWTVVGDGGRVTIKGGGWGHGRGMSQYGALGAARAGLGYRKILRFYYPDTAITTRQAPMRVLLSQGRSRRIVVKATPGLKLRDLGRKRTFKLPARTGIKRWRLVQKNGKTRVSYRADGAWHPHLVKGKRPLVGEGLFRAPAKHPITMFGTAGKRQYRGKLHLAAGQTINRVSMNNYLRSVIPAEVPAGWPAATLRAQAVAARTYAMRIRDTRPAQSWHICDTTSCQVYAGIAAEHPATDAAVRATVKEILTQQGRPVLTEYSSSNGGWTAGSALPYQVVKQDPYDTSSVNPNYTWTATVDRATVEAAFPDVGTMLRLRVVERDGADRWGGRVITLVLDGSAKRIRISGDQARTAFGLRSTLFTLVG